MRPTCDSHCVMTTEVVSDQRLLGGSANVHLVHEARAPLFLACLHCSTCSMVPESVLASSWELRPEAEHAQLAAQLMDVGEPRGLHVHPLVAVRALRRRLLPAGCSCAASRPAAVRSSVPPWGSRPRRSMASSVEARHLGGAQARHGLHLRALVQGP